MTFKKCIKEGEGKEKVKTGKSDVSTLEFKL